MELTLKYLQSIGPFTTPLCVAMGLALKWLLKDRQRVLDALEAANVDRMQLREKRAEDLREAAVEYREFGEAQRATIDQLVASSNATIARLGARSDE